VAPVRRPAAGGWAEALDGLVGKAENRFTP
jgi:hypothetical protein